MTTQTIHIAPARAQDDWAVRHLFGELHAFNASLDPRFALADGWERLLDEHLAQVRSHGGGLTALAWSDADPLGLIMLDGHSDSPLFRHRHWVELLALYVVPCGRGGEVAGLLLSEGLAWAGGRGYERVQLYVTASNVRAKAFYARAGFRPVQEIWRLELGDPSAPPFDDPSCDAAHASGQDLLSVTPHQLRHEA